VSGQELAVHLVDAVLPFWPLATGLLVVLGVLERMHQ